MRGSIARPLMNEIKAWIRFKHSNDQEDERVLMKMMYLTCVTLCVTFCAFEVSLFHLSQMQFLLQILPAELGSDVAKKLNQKLFSKVLRASD